MKIREVLAQRRAAARERVLAPVGRWNLLRKAELCHAIARGLITRGEAKAAHGLTDDEINEWARNADRGGVEALRITRSRREGRVA